MTERDELINKIQEIAQELISEDGLDFNIFRLTHGRCLLKQETELKTRIVSIDEFGGHSEGYIAKRLFCPRHNRSSKWVHVDY